MTRKSYPIRLVTVIAPNNPAVTLSSMRNAISSLQSNVKSSDVHLPERALILCDAETMKKTNIDFIVEEAKGIRINEQTNLSVELLEMPVINSLLQDDFPYLPEDGDAILTLPGAQIHFALLLDRLHRGSNDGQIQSAFIFHTEPDGQSVQWKRLEYDSEMRFAVDSMDFEHISYDSIEWIMASCDVEYTIQSQRFPNSKVDDFIKMEEEARVADGNEVTDAIIELAGIDEKSSKRTLAGKALERVAAYCINRNEAIGSVLLNVEFAGESKMMNIDVKREEDIIALTKRGSLIYASCKFMGRRTNRGRRSIFKRDVGRMKTLVLPLNFPKERIHRMIITTTPFLRLAEGESDIIVTNLKGLDEALKNL